jgi:hypothetical protein
MVRQERKEIPTRNRCSLAAQQNCWKYWKKETVKKATFWDTITGLQKQLEKTKCLENETEAKLEEKPSS